MDEKPTKTEKVKLPLRHSTFMKVLAFILCLVMLAALAGSITGAALMWEYDVYRTDKEDFLTELCWGAAYSDAHNLGYYVGCDNYEAAAELLERKNIEAAQIVCSGAQKWTWNYGSWDDGGETLSYELTWNYDVMDDGLAIPGYDGDADNTMLIRLRLADSPTAYDEYWLAYYAAEIAYAMMYSVYLLIILALAVTILCLVFLLNAAGHRPKKPGVTPAWTTAIPFDLLTAAGIGLGVGSVYLCDALMWRGINGVFVVFVVSLAVIADAVIVLLWLMSFALRIKLGTWWRNTLVFLLLRLVWQALKWYGKLMERCWGALRRFGERVALFWKAVIVFCVVALVEFIVIMATEWALGMEVFLWVVGRMVLLAGLVYFCHILKEMYNCGKAVAEGDMSYEVDTRLMPSQFREHAENLRSLSATVNRAVEQRMASERMKTELITNVSHDLKTPLTSLINYSDLICRESCDNPSHGEYAQVLHRQSERLRRLIDDLVEASKASSGNLDVELSPCEAGVLLMQAAGEYEQRLQEKGLQLVASQPVHRLMIMADGRRLWRVMDNLMNNICKYALSGTRVYLTLEDIGGEAVISFKNTSRDQLNLRPEELLERFVRGDASRGGEGSGLGLSIARSLTELQGGKMELMCDGDLFKVVLRFPVIK